MLFNLLAIYLINKSRDPFRFIYWFLYNVNTHTKGIYKNPSDSL